MKKLNSILFAVIIFPIGTFLTSCSTTTNLSFKEDNYSHIKTKLYNIKKDKNVGVEVSLLLENEKKVSGELLSARDSAMILCKEYSAKEEELSKLAYPILIVPHNNIQQLTIEGSSWVWEGIGAGYLVGGLAGLAIGSTFEDSREKDFAVMGLLIVTGTMGAIAGGITGYALSTEEYIIKEIPPDYNWFILKSLARYQYKEPEYLRALE